jgi:hypothetical protein
VDRRHIPAAAVFTSVAAIFASGSIHLKRGGLRRHSKVVLRIRDFRHRLRRQFIRTGQALDSPMVELAGINQEFASAGRVRDGSAGQDCLSSNIQPPHLLAQVLK